MKKNLFSLYFLLLTISVHAQGSLLLVGGGGENYNDWSDKPYKWLVEHAPNRKILVLHYSSTSSWLEGYFKSFGAVSAVSYVITSTSAANDSASYKAIIACDGLFLRGGDQWQYVSKWRGTLAAKAIREVFQRGGVVGGSSAGEMVLSEIVFDAQLTSLDPRLALRGPATSQTTLTDDFLSLAPNCIVDSHFYERGRLGRLPVMMTYYRTLKGREITGIGIDYNTALAVEPDGIGEVMGSGTVTVLRYLPTTTTAWESGKSYSASNFQFNQLSAGFRFSLNTGSIQKAATAMAFTPIAFESPQGTVILDGGNALSEWSAANGSMRTLQDAIALSGGSIGIITSPVSQSSAVGVQTTFTGWGLQAKVIPISESQKNSANTATEISLCNAFVLVGNSIDSAAQFLNTGTATGAAFRARISQSASLLFLSDDVMLAGNKGVGKLYLNKYGAYYGYLTQAEGLSIVKGLQIVPRLYEHPDYTDNRTSGMFWSMGKSNIPYGILLDNSSYVKIANNQLTSWGATPAIVVDARNSSWVDFPLFKDPGKSNPRQNAAILDAKFHVLRQGGRMSLTTGEVTEVAARMDEIPNSYLNMENYPNPFNPATTLRYSISQSGKATLKIFDSLGREVAILVDEQCSAGTYETRWDASKNASGIYFARLNHTSLGKMNSATCKIVLTK